MVSRTINTCNRIMEFVGINEENDRISHKQLKSIVVREVGGDRRTINKYMGTKSMYHGYLFSLGYLKMDNPYSFKILRYSVDDIDCSSDIVNIEDYGRKMREFNKQW